MQQLTTAFGDYSLQRLPQPSQQNLRAWDAADELVLNYLAEHQLPLSADRVLVVNDSFGALSCSLHQYSVNHWSDSWISHLATQSNRQLNQLDSAYQAISSTETPATDYAIVIIKIPKTLALLEQQLITLSGLLNSSTTVIAAGMVKYLQKSHLKLFERYLGSTTTSRAVKKARLYFSAVEKPATTHSPYPSEYFLDHYQLHIANHANVFSREKLDIGARFMLQQFNHLPTARSIVDLGCGNGILGIIAKQQQPDASVYFIDESYMAIESARVNYARALAKPLSACEQQRFIVSNSLEQSGLEGMDLILCNPPFHQSNTIGEHIAIPMFMHSKQALKSGGTLWVIGNRHLNYYARLKQVFGNCTTLASNNKFVVLSAIAN